MYTVKFAKSITPSCHDRLRRINPLGLILIDNRYVRSSTSRYQIPPLSSLRSHESSPPQLAWDHPWFFICCSTRQLKVRYCLSPDRHEDSAEIVLPILMDTRHLLITVVRFGILPIFILGVNSSNGTTPSTLRKPGGAIPPPYGWHGKLYIYMCLPKRRNLVFVVRLEYDVKHMHMPQ